MRNENFSLELHMKVAFSTVYTVTSNFTDCVHLTD